MTANIFGMFNLTYILRLKFFFRMLRRKNCSSSLDATVNYPRAIPVAQTNARVDKMESNVFRHVEIVEVLVAIIVAQKNR